MKTAFILFASLCAWTTSASVIPDIDNTTQLVGTTFDKRASATIVTKCKKPKTFAFTFDDGPYGYEPELVKELASYGAKATFFVNGNNWDCIYDMAETLQATYLAGHTIGSHTWEHVDIATISGTELRKDVKKVETALKKILGIKPALFRPPYGSYTNSQLKVLQKMGYTSVYWTMDTGDSVGASASQSKKVYKSESAAKDIVLNHETYKSTVKTVIPYALNLIKEKGYKMVTVDECLGIEPYQAIYIKNPTAKKMPKRNSTWKC